MDADVKARLESHAQAFESLLSLIPANEYYARDNSDQWQRKKQTKDEKRAARIAKLDPANQKSALDVMHDNERKRKRELGIASDDDAQQPADKASERSSKKPKVDETSGQAEETVSKSQSKSQADKRREKRERKKIKIDRLKHKADAKKAKKESQKQETQHRQAEVEAGAVEDSSHDDADEMDDIDASGILDGQASPASSSQAPDSPVFDISTNISTTSSSTSIAPPTDPHVDPTTDKSEPASMQCDAGTATPESVRAKRQKAFTMPKINAEELQARLRARIEQLRANRKADGPDGQPARSRQELLETRRKKSEARKQHKKELRAKAKAEEERLNQERLQGSGSPLSADIFSPRSPANEASFAFSQIQFEDGAVANPTLQAVKMNGKKRGPQDAKAALEAAQKKAHRLSGMDEERRKDVEQKDSWHAARKRAHGERVRDDTSLLKKTLQRKDKAKLKSEKAWQAREDGVKKGQEMRQKKREDNLAKRREEKGVKGKKHVKTKGKKRKGRPGFEGKF